MSIRTEGQVELLLWAAAEAHRLRVEPKKTLSRPVHANMALGLPPEQFTTEWQTACFAEPAS